MNAFLRLRRKSGLEGLKLHLTGGATKDDKLLIREVKKTVRAAGAEDDVHFFSDFSRLGRIRFLEELTLLSVPSRRPEAFGTFIIEALAAGVPVVQPKVGGFSEVLEATGGGLLYDPGDAGTEGGYGELHEQEYGREIARCVQGCSGGKTCLR